MNERVNPTQMTSPIELHRLGSDVFEAVRVTSASIASRGSIRRLNGESVHECVQPAHPTRLATRM